MWSNEARREIQAGETVLVKMDEGFSEPVTFSGLGGLGAIPTVFFVKADGSRRSLPMLDVCDLVPVKP